MISVINKKFKASCDFDLKKGFVYKGAIVDFILIQDDDIALLRIDGFDGHAATSIRVKHPNVEHICSKYECYFFNIKYINTLISSGLLEPALQEESIYE